MNFKQFFLESVNSNIKVIRELTPLELQLASHSHSQSSAFTIIKKYDKGWLAEWESRQYVILPNYIENWQGPGNQKYNIYYTKESTYKKQPVQLTLELTTILWVNGHKVADKKINDAIDLWNLKHSINPSTAKQFEELIDEL